MPLSGVVVVVEKYRAAPYAIRTPTMSRMSSPAMTADGEMSAISPWSFRIDCRVAV